MNSNVKNFALTLLGDFHFSKVKLGVEPQKPATWLNKMVLCRDPCIPLNQGYLCFTNKTEDHISS